MKIYKISVFVLAAVFSIWALPASAHRSPDGCSGSGLGINLYANPTQAHVGDTISYSVEVYNGTGPTPVACDATAITATLTTPDGVVHALSLVRTALSNTQLDSYSDVITYVARTQDVSGGILAATTQDSGTIHQNDTDSVGGGNQGVNVTLIAAPSVTPTPSPTVTPTVTPTTTPPIVPPTIITTGGGGCGSNCGGGGGGPAPRPSITPVTSTTTVKTFISVPPTFPNSGYAPRDEDVSISLWATFINLCSQFFQ